ncbi:MAG: putative enoyl-CoA hydratase [Ilumatobacteraceae bacterium]|nr:putative enoyl-CoA hydratase [Ilumatobacteraceae bacterium]
MTSSIELSQVADGIVTMTLNRPEKKNALSIALRDEASDALDRLAGDPDVRVLVITGAGTVFSAGFDLGEFAEQDPAHVARLWASSDRFHHGVLRFPLPVIAAVNGPAMAGGFDLAVLADIRVAAQSARFAHPEQRWASVVYRPLRELVGGAVARDLALTGRSVGADEALRLGLVSRVVPDGQLTGAVAEIAASIAAAPREVLMSTKAKIIAAADIGADVPTLGL